MIKVIQFVFENFGPLVAYYAVKAAFGFQIAVIASLAVTFFEVGMAIKKKKKLSALFIVSTITTVLFGILDLYLQNAVFLKYESVVTNMITGFFFLGTLWAEESAILGFIKKQNPERVINGKVIYRTRVLTVIWAGYFFLKAAVYAYISNHYSDIEGAAFRAGVGSISFYVLLTLSVTQSRRVFDFLETKRILVTPSKYLTE